MTNKRVLVPLDGSREAESVLPFVLEIARPLDLEVVLVQVMPAWGSPVWLGRGRPGRVICRFAFAGRRCFQ
jgi:hypothetical protein